MFSSFWHIFPISPPAQLTNLATAMWLKIAVLRSLPCISLFLGFGPKFWPHKEFQIPLFSLWYFQKLRYLFHAPVIAFCCVSQFLALHQRPSKHWWKKQLPECQFPSSVLFPAGFWMLKSWLLHQLSNDFK